MLQAAKIIGTGLAITALIGASIWVGVVLGAIILGLARNLRLKKLYASLEWVFYSPPKPHKFLALPLQSGGTGGWILALIADIVLRVFIISLFPVVDAGLPFPSPSPAAKSTIQGIFTLDPSSFDLGSWIYILCILYIIYRITQQGINRGFLSEGLAGGIRSFAVFIVLTLIYRALGLII